MILLSLFIIGSCKNRNEEVIIFHAGSLAVPLSKAINEYQESNPGVRILTEAAGSIVSARKISELGKPCDIMASADYRVIDDILTPEYADWNLGFATNEIVIAYTDKSDFSDIVNDSNWVEVLLRKDVVFGRSDPDADPCGYRTLLMLSLAEGYYGMDGLKNSFENKDREYIRPKEIDLTALLQSSVVDFVFQYKSVALQHSLRYLQLPPEINLGDPSMADRYRSVSQEIVGSRPGETVLMKGDYIMYGITLLKDAPSRVEAEKFLAFLLGPRGREIFRETGQNTISPPVVYGNGQLPEPVRKAMLR